MTAGIDTGRQDRLWAALSMLLMLAVAIVLQWGTAITSRGPTFDERWITRPIAELIRNGWSVETAIDFEEAKGPAMVWPYAAIGGVMVDDPMEVAPDDAPPGGGDDQIADAWTPPVPGGSWPAPPSMLASLRLISVLCLVLAVVPLLVIAVGCGVRGPPLLLVTWLLIVLPYQAVTAQMVMGEPSFVLLSLCLFAVVLWGAGSGNGTRHRIAGPVCYGVLLLVLLHSRVHAVAFAPAVCLVMWQRESWRSWPWWVASLAAGVLRLPLWARWGGLVSPEFQNLHGLGLRLESLTYLGAAMAPLLGVFLLAWLWRRKRHLWYLPVFGMAIGAVLGLVAMPDLTPLAEMDLSVRQDHYAGLVSTLSRRAGWWVGTPQIPMLVMSIIGVGGLGALGALALATPARATIGLAARFQWLIFMSGWLLYALTRGSVFDRYLLAWGFLLPIVWVATLPRGLIAAQAFGLAIIAWLQIDSWLL